MNDAALVAVLLQIGAHDVHVWTAQPLLQAARELHADLLDAGQARGRTGWLVFIDDRPVLAVIESRLHWSGMSVPLDFDPFLAVAQAVSALDAGRGTGSDSRRW